MVRTISYIQNTTTDVNSTSAITVTLKLLNYTFKVRLKFALHTEHLYQKPQCF